MYFTVSIIFDILFITVHKTISIAKVIWFGDILLDWLLEGGNHSIIQEIIENDNFYNIYTSSTRPSIDP